MNKMMMIIGAEIKSSNENDPDASIIKLTLIPLTIVRKKTVLSKIMASDDVEEMLDVAKRHEETQLKDTVYITTKEWRERAYKIGRHVTLSLLPNNDTGGIK